MLLIFLFSFVYQIIVQDKTSSMFCFVFVFFFLFFCFFILDCVSLLCRSISRQPNTECRRYLFEGFDFVFFRFRVNTGQHFSLFQNNQAIIENLQGRLIEHLEIPQPVYFGEKILEVLGNVGFSGFTWECGVLRV